MKNTENRFLISIVMPVTGRSDLLKQTLNCLNNQVYKHFELIVTDDTFDEIEREKIKNIVDEFVENSGISTKYIFTQPRLYQSNNVNQGIAAAKGDYIHILHGDDILSTDALRLESEFLSENPQVGLVYFQYTMFFTETFKTGEFKRFKILSPKLFMKKELIHSHPLPSGCVFSRKLLEDSGLMDPQFNFICDFDLFYRLNRALIKQNKYIIQIDSKYFGWRQHEHSVSTSDIVFQREYLPFMKKIYNTEINDPNSELQGPSLVNFLLFAREHRYHRILEMLSGSRKKLNLSNLPELIKICYKDRIFYKQLSDYKNKIKYPKNQSNKIFNEIEKNNSFSGNIFIKKEHKPEGKVLEISDLKDNQFPAAINHNFDNNFSLYDNRLTIAKYDSIVVTNINHNRYSKKVIKEILKCININQTIDFVIADNHFFTAGELIQYVEKTSKNQLELIEKIEYDFSRCIVKYKCINKPNYSITDDFSGFTFGLILNKNNENNIKEFINSIKGKITSDYEIIIATAKNVENSDNYSNIKFLNTANLNNAQIKNLICLNAKYSEILIAQEGIILGKNFENDFKSAGHYYGIKVPKVIDIEGNRLKDWCYCIGNNIQVMNYKDYSEHSFISAGVVLIRKAFALQHKWDETIDKEEDLAYSKTLNEKGEIIELLETKIISIDTNLEKAESNIYKNPFYEEINDTIIIGSKKYKLHKNKLLVEYIK